MNSIDSRHYNAMVRFQQNREVHIPAAVKKHAELAAMLATVTDVRQRQRVERDMAALDNTALELEREEREYYVNNARDLMAYFEHVQKQQQQNTIAATSTARKQPVNEDSSSSPSSSSTAPVIVTGKQQIILNMFTVKPSPALSSTPSGGTKEDEDVDVEDNDDDDGDEENGGVNPDTSDAVEYGAYGGMAVRAGAGGNNTPPGSRNQQQIASRYLYYVDPAYVLEELYTAASATSAAASGSCFASLFSNVTATYCTYCHVGKLITSEEEGMRVCNHCAVIQPYYVDADRNSYKETPKETCFYTYHRINHFKEIVAQFQGKESTYISDAVLHQIQERFKKERLTKPSDLTHANMRSVLHTLGMSKKYEHIPYILGLMGVPPPVFSVELEEALYSLFLQTLEPYAKIYPSTRCNFCNYSYMLFKFLELLSCTEYLHLVPMLKERDKILELDHIFKQICELKGWVFYPTV